jgi:hypothetical protein
MRNNPMSQAGRFGVDDHSTVPISFDPLVCPPSHDDNKSGAQESADADEHQDRCGHTMVTTGSGKVGDHRHVAYPVVTAPNLLGRSDASGPESHFERDRGLPTVGSGSANRITPRVPRRDGRKRPGQRGSELSGSPAVE